MRRYFALFSIVALCVAARAATLQYLTLDQMTSAATAIVRGTVLGSHTAVRGPVIYTVYTMRVSERLKGRPATTIDIAIPGGVADGVRQTFAGAPELATGGEYLIFAWRTQSGLNVIIGLSQGLFSVDSAAAGSEVMQTSTQERIVNSSGRDVAITPVHMAMAQMRAQIQRIAEVRQ
ncbi:MAG TPA: hypothetical protein VFA04_16245 [Bryobacteraceae bacterium]|nr:hypothetical protein [Bryobacteraceae bacterium]